MFQLQLKQIETSIASGRLDEAFEMLLHSSQRDHRQGQQLTDLLAERLIQRAREHLDVDRVREAKSDADNAFQLVGHTLEARDLLERIASRDAKQKAAISEEREAAGAARIQAHLGRFTLGQNFLANGSAHTKLAAEIERKRAIATNAAGRVEFAIESGDFHEAVAVLRSLDQEILRHRLVTEKINVMIKPMLQQGRQRLKEGRLDRVCEMTSLISSLVADQPELSELRNCLQRCFKTIDLVDQAKYSEADRELALVEQMIGRCRWTTEIRESLTELDRHAKSLQNSALGLLDGQVMLDATLATQPDVPSCRPLSESIGNETENDATVLRVDGLGTILLLSSQKISIGSYSNSKRYDVPIQTDGPSDPLFIRRAGEDYFAESASPFRINNRPSMQRLLSAGDSIVFGKRGRLRFRKPVAASGSAVLRVTGAGLPKREIRDVALMADSLLFSRQGGHFSLPDSGAPIVVFLGPNGYAIKFAGSGGDVSNLQPGRSVLIGETRFTLNQINLS